MRLKDNKKIKLHSQIYFAIAILEHEGQHLVIAIPKQILSSISVMECWILGMKTSCLWLKSYFF